MHSDIISRPEAIVTGLGQGRLLKSYGDTQMRVLVPAEATAGRYAIWEHVCAAHSGPPRHVHHREDEIFQVLEGKLLVWCDGDSFEAGPGGFAALPRGVPHSFRVISDTPARLVMTVVPGGFERFFAAVAGLSLPTELNRMIDIGGSFGLDFVGPPLEG